MRKLVLHILYIPDNLITVGFQTTESTYEIIR